MIACGLNGACGADASLDAPLHQAVYRHNPAARAVLHSHGPYTVALTLGSGDFIPPDFEGQYYFRCVPVLDIAYEDYLRESPQRVAEALVDNHIVVVRGHGVYAAGESINLAYKWINSLELSAKTAYIAAQAGTLR